MGLAFLLFLVKCALIGWTVKSFPKYEIIHKTATANEKKEQK